VQAVWAEYCRCKDLLKYLKDHPDKMSNVVKAAGERIALTYHHAGHRGWEEGAVLLPPCRA
jgi:hypothetical protein